MLAAGAASAPAAREDAPAAPNFSSVLGGGGAKVASERGSGHSVVDLE